MGRWLWNFIKKKMVAKVVVTGAVTGNRGYNTLTDAFNAINSGDQSASDIIITIEQGTTEPNTGAVLNHGNWNSLKINPGLPVTSRTISGTVNGGPLIDFNGADKVTMDGVFMGGFVFKNLSTDSLSGTCTISFRNDASNNYVKNLIIEGNSKTNFISPAATVLFGDGVTTGNDNNVIDNCNITPGSGQKVNCSVYFQNGSSSENNNDTIKNCWIGNYFNSLGSSAGVMIGAGNSNTAVINNRFHSSGLNIITTVPGNPLADHYMIRIKNTSGSGFSLRGNILGYNGPFGTGRYAIESRPNSHVYGIHVQAGTSQVTNITGNTITNIDITGSMSGTNTFVGIITTSGVINIDSNVIGNKTDTGSIRFVSTEWYNNLSGVKNESAHEVTTNNNFVGGISISTPYAYFAGIYGNHFSPWTVNNNTIGSALPNSIHNQSPGVYSQTAGLVSTNSGSHSFTNNIIQNLTSDGGEDPTILSIAGIIAGSYRYNVSGNTIRNLKNNTTTGTAKMVGIAGSHTIDTGLISSNNIHSFSLQNNGASMTGILMRSTLRADVFNNMISLGTGETGSKGYSICGINDSLGTNNYFYNSVYIGGKPVSGNLNTYALRTNSTSPRIFKNNIFYNNRSNNGSTGKHYSVGVTSVSSATAMISDYNDIYASGTGSFAAFYNGANLLTLNDWKAISLKDDSSISENPFYKDTTDLHIDSLMNSPVVSAGTPVAGITTDFDGNPRSGVHPFIGADEYYVAPLVTTLNLEMFIQGFYNATTNLQVSDTIRVYLRNFSSPFSIVDSAKALVSDSGKAELTFNGLANGNYYIVITHRNSLETWSVNALSMTEGSVMTYDFTTASSKAYGDNLFQSEPGVYSDYSGEVIKDGSINLNDIIAVSNAATGFATGYVNTDVNGDGLVNLNDIIITYNKAGSFVTVKRP